MLRAPELTCACGLCLHGVPGDVRRCAAIEAGSDSVNDSLPGIIPGSLMRICDNEIFPFGDFNAWVRDVHISLNAGR